MRTLKEPYKDNNMYWTLELASKLEDAPWPATKDELIDYAMRSGAPLEVIENLQELEDEGDVYETIEDVWPDYPTKEDFLFNEDEYCHSPNRFEQSNDPRGKQQDLLAPRVALWVWQFQVGSCRKMKTGFLHI